MRFDPPWEAVETQGNLLQWRRIYWGPFPCLEVALWPGIPAFRQCPFQLMPRCACTRLLSSASEDQTHLPWTWVPPVLEKKVYTLLQIDRITRCVTRSLECVWQEIYTSEKEMFILEKRDDKGEHGKFWTRFTKCQDDMSELRAVDRSQNQDGMWKARLFSQNVDNWSVTYHVDSFQIRHFVEELCGESVVRFVGSDDLLRELLQLSLVRVRVHVLEPLLALFPFNHLHLLNVARSLFQRVATSSYCWSKHGIVDVFCCAVCRL